MTGLLSPAHIAILLVVLLLVFGAKGLPELGRSLGSGMREFKHSISGEHDEEPAALAPATQAVPDSSSPSAVVASAPGSDEPTGRRAA